MFSACFHIMVICRSFAAEDHRQLQDCRDKRLVGALMAREVTRNAENTQKISAICRAKNCIIFLPNGKEYSVGDC